MDFPITATEVGTLITYVAPGFFLQLGYRTKFPAPEQSAGWVLIVSVVLSLPLVAIAVGITNWLSISHRPLAVGYAVSLTLGAFVLGYVVACVRETHWTKKRLAFFDYWAQPESSIYAQTLYKIGGGVVIEVRLLSGERLRGVPTIGPLAKDDGVDGLHLSSVQVAAGADFVEKEGWKSVVIPLSQIDFIALGKDPTPQNVDWKSYKDHWATHQEKKLEKKNKGSGALPGGAVGEAQS